MHRTPCIKHPIAPHTAMSLRSFARDPHAPHTLYQASDRATHSHVTPQLRARPSCTAHLVSSIRSRHTQPCHSAASRATLMHRTPCIKHPIAPHTAMSLRSFARDPHAPHTLYQASDRATHSHVTP